MTDYKARFREDQKKELARWKELIQDLFGEVPKDSVTVTDKVRIIDILNKIGTNKVMNHTFIPSGDGLDLSGARTSNESGLVELNLDGTTSVTNPNSLSFHPIGENPEWWYFRLNTRPFEVSGVYGPTVQEEVAEDVFKTPTDKQVEWEMSYVGEEVLEVEPGRYVERSYWDMNCLGYDEFGNEIPLPKGARVVTRQHKGGAYVIFPKLSAYNRNSATYDARHNRFDDEGFHHYISKIVEELAKRD
jgi:serine/threonine-protein kinase